jgi:hypothetical protein
MSTIVNACAELKKNNVFILANNGNKKHDDFMLRLALAIIRALYLWN